MKFLPQKMIRFGFILISLTACTNNNSEMWKKYHKLNGDSTDTTSSKLHDKYIDMNNNTDSKYSYSWSEAHSKY